MQEEEIGTEFSIASDEAYVACAQTHCWRCRAAIEVICVYCATGEINGDRYEDFTVSNVTAIDEHLRQQLAHWPLFRFAYSRAAGGRYLANHCPHCRALQGDYFLHCEPGGAFFSLKETPPGVLQLVPLRGRIRLSGDEGFEP